MDPIVQEPVRGTIGDFSVLQLPGLEAMRRAVRGKSPSPPIHHLLGLTPTEVGLGTSTFTMPVTPWLEDAFGIIYSVLDKETGHQAPGFLGIQGIYPEDPMSELFEHR